MHLLHIDSSIQGGNSASRAISQAIVEQLRAAGDAVDITYRDLTATPLAHFTLDTAADPEARGILAEFQAADTIVIGAPLYNFTVSGQLKAWIDRILVAGETFRYTEHGPEGLAGGKRVIVALTRGGIYSGQSPFASFEHAETLLRNVLAFIGITAPEFIVAEGLALGEEPRRAAIAGALAQAGQVTGTQALAAG